MKEEIHIGNLIKEKLKARDLTASWLARQVHSDCSNFSKMLRKPNLDSNLLIKISTALDYDFFSCLSEHLQKDIKKK